MTGLEPWSCGWRAILIQWVNLPPFASSGSKWLMLVLAASVLHLSNKFPGRFVGTMVKCSHYKHGCKLLSHTHTMMDDLVLLTLKSYVLDLLPPTHE